MQNRKAIRLIIFHVLAIGGVCYACILISIFALPHFPLAGKKNFKLLMTAQMTLDRYQEFQQEGNGMLMLLGSSVMERGVSTITLDSLLLAERMQLRSSNCAAMGMFARMSVSVLKTMLASGIRPQMIVYGFYLDELNGLSTIHDNTVDSVSSVEGVKPKTLENLFMYGPRALSTMFIAGTFQMYPYMLNGAYRDVDTLSLFQHLFAGDRAGASYTTFLINRSYIADLTELTRLCSENHIPLAFCNAPLRPKIESLADFPYQHRLEAYQAVEKIAESAEIPIWNTDVKGLFENSDFFDINHLNPRGARKFARILGRDVAEWRKGVIRHDTMDQTNLNLIYSAMDDPRLYSTIRF